jgi:hypothetical protein
VRAGSARPGRPILACGAPEDSLAAIDLALASRGLKLVGLRSTIVEAINRHARHLRRREFNGWLAVTGADWLTLVLMVASVPVDVRSVVRGPLPLRQVLERECRLSGVDPAACAAWLIGLEASDRQLQVDLEDLRRAGWSADAHEPLLDDVDAEAVRPRERVKA